MGLFYNDQSAEISVYAQRFTRWLSQSVGVAVRQRPKAYGKRVRCFRPSGRAWLAISANGLEIEGHYADEGGEVRSMRAMTLSPIAPNKTGSRKK